jgi:hypothetical protein
MCQTQFEVSHTRLSLPMAPLSSGVLLPLLWSSPFRSLARHSSTPNRYGYGLESIRFGLFPVRSPLLRKSMFLSLPRVTKMFQFTRFASHTYGFSMGYLRFASSGFPHSDISGSTLACSSPERFAAGCVLLRPLTPRHPPCALIRLTYREKLFLSSLYFLSSLCSFQGAMTKIYN